MKRWNRWSKAGLVFLIVAAMTAQMGVYVFAEDVQTDYVVEVVEAGEVWEQEQEVPYVEPAQEETPVVTERESEVPAEQGQDTEIVPAADVEPVPAADVDPGTYVDPGAVVDPGTVVDPGASVEPTAPAPSEPVTFPNEQQTTDANVTEPEAGTTAASSENYDVEGVSNSELESYLSERGMGEWISSIDSGDGSAASYSWGLNTLTREPASLKGYNFVIFGLSGENSGDDGRSDTIIICTIDPERHEIKLTSILRDTKAAIEGHEPQKINAAHMLGGPELAVETLNKNFGLTLKDYVTVQFETLMDIVDMVGGIEIELTQDEADFINEFSVEYGIPPLSAGVQTLSGWQSVLYCRIRKIDSDKVRAGRQQLVIRKIFEKLRGAGFLQWFQIAVRMLETTTISMPLGDILEVLGLPLSEYTLVNNVVPDIEYETELKTAIDEHGEWVWLYDLGKAGDWIVNIINNQ